MNSELLAIMVFNDKNETFAYPDVIQTQIYKKCCEINKIFEQQNAERFFEGDSKNYCCLKKNTHLCIVVSRNNFPLRIQKETVNRILDSIGNQNVTLGKSAIEKILKTNFEFSANMNNDKIISIQRDIDEVKDTMMANIEKTLERGDKIDTLSTKSQTMAEQAKTFQNNSTELKKQLCMRNVKLIAAVGFCIGVVILIIVLMAIK